MKITFKEEGAFGGVVFSLKIDEGIVYFEGIDDSGIGSRFPAKIKLTEAKEEQIISALKLLELDEWKEKYRPEDVGSVVDDGIWWDFSAVIKEKNYVISGVNAYPKFSTPSETSLDEERYSLLREALFSALYSRVSYKEKYSEPVSLHNSGGCDPSA